MVELILLLAMGCFSGYEKGGEQTIKEVVGASISNGIPVRLLLAQSYVESRHKWWVTNKNARKRGIDRGVMQINSRYVEGFALMYEQEYGEKLTEWEKKRLNYQLGAFILKKWYNRFNDWEKALLSYNAGVGAVSRGKVPQSSIEYANEVLFNANWFGFFYNVLPSITNRTHKQKNIIGNVYVFIDILKFLIYDDVV